MKIPDKPPPSHGSEEERRDLIGVIRQYKNRKVPEELQKNCDEDMSSIFADYIMSNGMNYNKPFFDKVHNGLRQIVRKMKKYYDRPRPKEVASHYGIDFPGDDLDTAQSPSYPSGHTIQAYVQAILLSDMFPGHTDQLMRIAEMISQSRIDRGVHFPSDVDFGRQVAYLIVRELLDGSA